MITSWHAYPQVYALGHRYVADLLKDTVTVEEKVDGSQFSFGLFDGNGLFTSGYRCRSKSADINVLAPERMFKKAVEEIQALPLHIGWTYRGEYLCKPKHNSLVYDRVPAHHVILFDINTGHEEYLPWDQKAEEANRIGLEVVPLLYEGVIESLEHFRTLLDTTSILGGQKIEGLVVKNYQRFGLDKKVLMGKFVSEAFKEVHAREWKTGNPASSDILDLLVATYRTPARWQKAVQHLTERGLLTHAPQDIGAILQEAARDIEQECKEEIKDTLFTWAWSRRLRRGVTAGLAEWYKEELLKKQFSVSPEEASQ